MNGNLEQALMAILKARSWLKYQLMDLGHVLNLKWSTGTNFSELKTWFYLGSCNSCSRRAQWTVGLA